MSAKQGEHAHEVQLSDGSVTMTGPPVELAAEETPEPEEAATGPQLGELNAPEQARRAKGLPASVLAGEQESKDAEAAARALGAGDPDLLPKAARVIYDRMTKSAFRYAKDARYAAGLGWRAIRQKYRIKTAGPVSTRPVAARTKTTLLGTVDGHRGGSWIVHVAGDKNADVLYERTEQLPILSAPGASVLVGLSRGNHRNILSVNVPRRFVSSQPGAPGPIDWCRRKWDEIYRTGKGSTPFVLTKKRAGNGNPMLRFVPFSGFGERSTPDGKTKFVTDPAQATQRIAFGELYRPWQVDLQGEYAREDEIERWAHDFMKRHGAAGEMHARWLMPDGTVAGVPVESFLVRPRDPDFPVPGAWVVGTEYRPEVWQKIVDRIYRGYSIGGRWGTRPIANRVPVGRLN